MKKIIVLFFIVVIILILAGCVAKNEEKNQKLKVAATIFPLVDIARNIGGDKVEVIQILPSGASPHTFEMTPQQIKDLQGTKAVFMIGQGLDDWVRQVSNSISNVELIGVDEGIDLIKSSGEEEHEEFSDENEKHEHGEYDPHYWLSIENAKIIAGNIENKLAEIDSGNKEFYKENLNNYLERLDKLERDVMVKLANIKTRKTVTFHEAWQYFADEFGFEIIATFEPFSGKEPTAKYIEELNKIVKDNNIKVIFAEPQMSDEVLKSFVEDLGLELYVLDPIGGVEGRGSYVEMMEYNGDMLGEALNK